MTLNSKNERKTLADFDFKCTLCGECCRAGYEVRVKKEDAIKWMEMDNRALIDNLMINIECISIDNHTDLNFKEGSALKEIKKEHSNYKIRLKELVKFIQETHLYYGTNCLRNYIKTIIPNIGYDPVLIPKDFKVLLKGLGFGLEYIIRNSSDGTCPFLKLNRCSIHNIKPKDCRSFPYNPDGSLRLDYPFVSICNGLKRMQKHI